MNGPPFDDLPRLLFVVTEDWYFCSHRLPLAKAALQAGFDVAVATRVRKHGEIIRGAGIRIIPFDIDRGGMNPAADVVAIAQLITIYRQERPNIVHHVALKPVLYGSIAALLARVPHVVNALTGFGWLFTSRGRKARLIRPIVQAVLRRLLRPSTVIVQNREDAAMVGKWNARRIQCIRGAGVDCALFQPTARPKGMPVILLPARMLWDKGVGEFVAAARSIRAAGLIARFVLVGAPDKKNPASVPLRQLSAWCDEGVAEWWGQREDMPNVYAQAHIVCLPSYREGLPKSLLEAAAAGLPIVAANVSGCREVVQHEFNGLLVPARDVHSLAVALIRLMSSPDECHLMGVRGRQRAEAEFSQEIVVSQTLTVYHEASGTTTH